MNIKILFLEKGHKKISLHIVDHDGLVLYVFSLILFTLHPLLYEQSIIEVSFSLIVLYTFIRFIPLHHAALSGSGEIVMGLLEFTTDVNAKDKKGLFLICLRARKVVIQYTWTSHNILRPEFCLWWMALGHVPMTCSATQHRKSMQAAVLQLSKHSRGPGQNPN